VSFQSEELDVGNSLLSVSEPLVAVNKDQGLLVLMLMLIF
jgi:hypothetical protein